LEIIGEIKLNQEKIKLVRHGDLMQIPLKLGKLSLIEIPNKIPTKAKKTNEKVLALGEATGHKHTLVGQSLIFQDEETKYIQVNEPSQITHQEHKTVPLEVGEYVQVQEREFDAFARRSRMVMD